jgi:hypothetical protein
MPTIHRRMSTPRRTERTIRITVSSNEVEDVRMTVVSSISPKFKKRLG